MKRSTGLDLLLMPPRVEASLWRRLRFERELRCREQIFARYRVLARSVASRQHRRRPRHGVDLRDFEQFAYEALLQAIDRYDPLRGVPFGAFARRRMIGNIADGAARGTERDALYAACSRQAAERARSIADGASEDDPIAALAQLASGLAIGLMIDATGADAPDQRPNAYESLAWRELNALLVGEIGRLPDRERAIVHHHYQDGLSFTQVADLLGLSKGRISQLHGAALDRLRRRLGQVRGSAG